jgi:hypothetical protein
MEQFGDRKYDKADWGGLFSGSSGGSSGGGWGSSSYMI